LAIDILKTVLPHPLRKNVEEVNFTTKLAVNKICTTMLTFLDNSKVPAHAKTSGNEVVQLLVECSDFSCPELEKAFSSWEKLRPNIY
jgi:hypothetical protein